jgi:2-polyprenyl-6-methoxyphenol hydroxylase-like FAD-dependent oxidoreductase
VQDVIVIGAGIGGLTLALALHRAGIPCRIYEAAPEIRPVGVGINLLPHAIVLTNRTKPPDAILGEVFRRTGDKPFRSIEDVISREELAAMSEGYKRVAGYDREKLRAPKRK